MNARKKFVAYFVAKTLLLRFFSNLNMEGITGSDYNYAKLFVKILKYKT